MLIGPPHGFLSAMPRSLRSPPGRCCTDDPAVLFLAKEAGAHGVYVQNALAEGEGEGFVRVRRGTARGLCWFGARGDLVVIAPEDIHGGLLADRVQSSRSPVAHRDGADRGDPCARRSLRPRTAGAPRPGLLRGFGRHRRARPRAPGRAHRGTRRPRPPAAGDAAAERERSQHRSGARRPALVARFDRRTARQRHHARARAGRQPRLQNSTSAAMAPAGS